MNEKPNRTDQTKISLPCGVPTTRGNIVSGAVMRTEQARMQREAVERANKGDSFTAVSKKRGGICACIKRGIAVLWRRKRTK